MNTSRALLPATLVVVFAACAAGDADVPATDAQMAAPPADAAEQPAADADAPAQATPPDEGTPIGTFIPASDTWDSVRDGLHLVLSYDGGLDAFTGMLTNNTDGTLCDVQASVGIENGPDLGPSAPVDLDAGGAHPIEIRADGEPVDFWTASSVTEACG